MILDVVSVVLAVAGCAFFGAGTVGLLRFPDLNNRLHALVKADNLGLGLVLAALALQSSVAVAVKLVLIWLLALLAAATSSYLLADRSEVAAVSAMTEASEADDDGAAPDDDLVGRDEEAGSSGRGPRTR
ncbi:monovalent cation/H(+) antiporter subunit G [Pseudactinotalea sp. Z1732]|uniref:monovalent cation/H(+) antiporter subunit G n=1 Tax=Micrococcales TaxID=85006 RepID=UPI003C7C6357